jgi:DNA topoisomerase-6 subunit B
MNQERLFKPGTPRKKARKRKAKKKAAAGKPAKAKAARAPKGAGRGETAESMAARQRDISIAEFFTKNRHLLGFDNPRKALLTAIKEGVDNSLDACEEAGILPDVKVEIRETDENRFHVGIEDNGPGIVKAQIPKIFAKLLYGSKFHRLRMSRGQQGIGISAAGLYGQLTTGRPIRITSRTTKGKPAHYYELHIDTHKNQPDILKEDDIDWNGGGTGTRVEIDLEGRYQKGRQSIDDYLEQTAIANPHVELIYQAPAGDPVRYERVSRELPPPPREIKPHPHGIELGMLMGMLKTTKARRLLSFLTSDFVRISSRVGREICARAELSEKARPTGIARNEADNLFRAINATKIMKPPADCISPIGEPLILKGLKKEVEADFYTAITRPPAVYRGNPFQIEVGLAWGGKLPQEDLARVLRYANRVPLLYQQSACCITKSVITTAWRNYRVPQSKGALPSGPLVLFVHMASVWVPFTSESKEAVAHYPEITKEIKLALQTAGRQLSVYLSRKRRAEEAQRKKDYIQKYIPHISIGLREILGLTETKEKQATANLKDILERSRT